MARTSIRLSIAAFIVTLMAAPVDAQRLPTVVKPTHYDLKVAPDLASATFSGEEAIKVTLAAATDRIVLNAAEIEFEDGDRSRRAGGRRRAW